MESWVLERRTAYRNLKIHCFFLPLLVEEMFYLVLGDHVFPDVVMPGSLAEEATLIYPYP